ncbi:MAG: GNAT family N-acetyltransferase [Dongiaceae bacterium]
MSATVTIRRARFGDARGIASVHVETWRTAYAGMLPDRVIVQMSVDEKAAAWRRMIEQQNGAEAVLVAAHGERVIGFANCSHAGPDMADYDGEIHMLYVTPDWQDRGIGRALLRGCFQALFDAGIDGAFLWVLADNPARFFYEAMGGQRIGERDERLWGVVMHESAYGWRHLDTMPQPWHKQDRDVST